MKKTVKKTLSIILAILMIVTTIPFAFAVDEAPDFSDAKVLSTGADGYLYIDGVKVSVALNIFDEELQLIPSGKYKLEGNAASSCMVIINEGEQVAIDLNGYEWSFTGTDCLTLEGDLSLYDLSENKTGKIVAETQWGTINMQGDSSIFNLYSGTLESTATNGYVLRTTSSNGQANLYGGTLKSCGYAMWCLLRGISVKIADTVLESGEGFTQIYGSTTYGNTPATVIDVSDFTGDSLTVDYECAVAGKHPVLVGVKSKEEADKYTINVIDEYSKTFLDKVEYDEATGEIYAYVVANAFTQQPTEENNYTVDFNNPNATYQWYEAENTALTSENTIVLDYAKFENGKWLHSGWHIEMFKVSVSAGDIITASTDSDYEFDLNVYTEDYSVDERAYKVTKTASVTIDKDAEVIVGIYINDSVTAEFEFELTGTTLLDGETEKTLKNPECEKTYFCMATADENMYSSDVVTVEHDIVIDEAVAPDCVNTGLTEGSHCSRCDYKVEQKEIPALGHDMVIDEAVAPDCVNTGLTEGSHCSRCDYKVEQEEVPALGHDIVIDEAVVPDCVNTGLTEGSHCSRCDYKVEQKEIPALGHDMVIDEAVAPDCVNTGLTEGSHCSRCDYKVEQEEVPALGHDMVIDEAVAPDCVNTGLTEGSHCSRCDYKVEQKEIPALGHDYESVVTESTCTETGYTTYTCTVCDNTYTDNEVDATGHNDNDNDGYCDECDDIICDHRCHKNGFFWKIIRFVYRVLNIQQYCDCGNLHYEKPIFGKNK